MRATYWTIVFGKGGCRRSQTGVAAVGNTPVLQFVTRGRIVTLPGSHLGRECPVCLGESLVSSQALKDHCDRAFNLSARISYRGTPSSSVRQWTAVPSGYRSRMFSSNHWLAITSLVARSMTSIT